MNTEIKQKLYQSIDIIKSCPGFLLICLLICLIGYISSVSDSEMFDLLSYLSYIIGFFFTPIAYGRYIEIINNESHISYSHIFKKHWINYYLVILTFMALLLPIIIVIDIFALTVRHISVSSYVLNLSFLFANAISIFIIPLIFILEKRLKAISLGFKCIIGNPKDSIYLIILVLVMYGADSLYSYYSSAIAESYTFAYVVFGVIVGLISMVINFVVFIIASLILKEKLLNV